MEQNREPRKKIFLILKKEKKIFNWSLTKEKRPYNGAKKIFSTNRARITGHSQVKKKKEKKEKKKESTHRPYTLHKI